MTRLYVDSALATGAELVLPDEAAHHVRSVLRLARDAEVILFNGRGGEYVARLTAVAREGVRALVGAARAGIAESPLSITLVQAISRGERMDYTIQKAVELGVQRIVPVVSQRTVVRLDGAREDKRLKHWRGVVRHAAEQSGRTSLPELAAVMSLADWRAARSGGAAYLLQPAVALQLARAAPPSAGVSLLAGPEGGFDQGEVELLLADGVTAVCLGPRILRTETAALVALAVMQARWGDLS